MHYYRGGDTFQYFNESAALASYLLSNPLKFFDIYLNTGQVMELSNNLTFLDQPRALFFSKIVSMFYIISGGNYWLISILLSFVNFTGINFLVNELNKKFSDLSIATYLSFYFLPTFVFWSSGLLKESLAIASLAIAIGVVIKFSRTHIYNKYLDWCLLVLAIIVLWKLKYFYGAIATPLLAMLLIYNIFYKHNKLKIIFTGFTLIIGLLLISNLHYNLNPSRILDLLYENYRLGVASSGKNYIQYYHFDGSPISYLVNTPIALFSGLFRPMIFEADSFYQYFVGIENLLICCLFLISLWQSGLKVNHTNIYTIATLLYIIVLAIFIAFSTPNFGTLSRYKVAYWPFFVLLIVILFLNKKGQALNEPDQNIS